MLRKDLIEATEPDDDTITPWVLECYRDRAWRAYRGLWNCHSEADARTRALSILDSIPEDTFRTYVGWRVIKVTHYAPEVDA